VLCVHGIQDNAGCFDGLIPLLPSVFYHVCIDLPGHGHSSHFPQGLPLDFMDYVLAIIRVLNQLQWDSCCYIGHCFGGQLGLYLCSLWPQRIRKLVLLDTLGPMCVKTDSYPSYIKMMFKDVVTIERKSSNAKSPSYSYKEALHRVMSNRFSRMTDEAAKILLRRCLMKKDDGTYSFVTDQRLKSAVWPLLNEEQQLWVCTYITNIA
jgi:pimeloyl-ACP methyl ester carboxylesterase